MYVVGLTGGIGTGKTTVARMLADRGAEVIDADVLAREVIARGTPGFDEVVEAFGASVVGADGSLDRRAIASLVFSDDEARARLNAIVHPKVYERIAARLAELSATDAIVVLDVPLLLESSSGSREAVAEVIVVVASEENALDRVVQRGLDRDDARARMRAQLPIEEKVRMADHVVSNDGGLPELEEQVDALWQQLLAKAGAAA
ncbi:MAG TPA: dephospho-CoA kinase [Actinomycetota bacterium]|nr:dephospho-CoA kinase [Actinomycetota bacterium]